MIYFSTRHQQQLHHPLVALQTREDEPRVAARSRSPPPAAATFTMPATKIELLQEHLRPHLDVPVPLVLR